MRPIVSSSYCPLILFITWQFGIQSMNCDSLVTSCQLETFARVLVADAGSTATRLYEYEFKLKDGSKKHDLKPQDLKINKVKTLSTKPALSTFDNPSKMADLRRLMKALFTDAETNLNLDTKCFPFIPVYLRATAGLRAMSETMQNLIIEEVKKEIKNSKFKKVRNNALVMSGETEGLYAWMALNYFHDTLNQDELDKSYSLLELGGGGMRIGTAKYSEEYESLVDEYDLFNKKYSLLIKSYLGLGLQAIRIYFFDLTDTGVCLRAGTTFNYKFGAVTKTLTGKAIANSLRYEVCYTIAKALVRTIDPIWTFVDDPGNIQATRGFYFPVKNANDISNNCATDNTKDECKKVSFLKSIKELETDAKAICANPPASGELQKPLCIDLVYTINILKNGFKVKNLDKKITFSNEVNKHEIQWPFGIASGAAFKTFSSAPKAIYSYSLLSLIAPLILTLCNISK